MNNKKKEINCSILCKHLLNIKNFRNIQPWTVIGVFFEEKYVHNINIQLLKLRLKAKYNNMLLDEILNISQIL